MQKEMTTEKTNFGFVSIWSRIYCSVFWELWDGSPDDTSVEKSLILSQSTFIITISPHLSLKTKETS